MVAAGRGIAVQAIHQAVRAACLWLPEAEEFVSHGSPNFRVRGKTFATYAVNHHGDGRVALWLNAPTGSQALHVQAIEGNGTFHRHHGVTAQRRRRTGIDPAAGRNSRRHDATAQVAGCIPAGSPRHSHAECFSSSPAGEHHQDVMQARFERRIEGFWILEGLEVEMSAGDRQSRIPAGRWGKVNE